MVLKLEFEKEFEQKFRELAMRKYGFAKGALSKASKEALKSWIKTEEKPLPKVKDPIALLEGCLAHLKGKYTSVELQHEAKKLWLKK